MREQVVDTGRSWRARVRDFIEGRRATTVIITLILINAVTLGLETDSEIMARYGALLHIVDRAILMVFTLELLLKGYAHRLAFFRSGWNIFDLLIVGIAWLPATGPLAILRALRILRVLRLLSVVPQMRRVITAIGHSIPGMTSVIGVLAVFFYVSSVLATKLFGMHPDPQMQEWFGSIGASAYTLFQVMTLESWSMGIVRPTMELYPLAWVFFVPFIVITSFAVLNLFIGIIVDAMQTTQREASAMDVDVSKDSELDGVPPVNAQLARLEQEFAALRSLLLQAEAEKREVSLPKRESSPP
ncbi:ion transporter [Algiphilus sp.]|uniref:ion transporter n=1 Tax=Algiphilus sp. TaxID=1872431 RepID=UPI003B524F6F